MGQNKVIFDHFRFTIFIFDSWRKSVNPGEIGTAINLSPASVLGKAHRSVQTIFVLLQQTELPSIQHWPQTSRSFRPKAH